MNASELKRLKELEAENSKLKKMYAELSLLNYAMKDVIDVAKAKLRRNEHKLSSNS
jgi:hypothetical protein